MSLLRWGRMDRSPARSVCFIKACKSRQGVQCYDVRVHMLHPSAAQHKVGAHPTLRSGRRQLASGHGGGRWGGRAARRVSYDTSSKGGRRWLDVSVQSGGGNVIQVLCHSFIHPSIHRPLIRARKQPASPPISQPSTLGGSRRCEAASLPSQPPQCVEAEIWGGGRGNAGVNTYSTPGHASVWHMICAYSQQPTSHIESCVTCLAATQIGTHVRQQAHMVCMCSLTLPAPRPRRLPNRPLPIGFWSWWWALVLAFEGGG